MNTRKMTREFRLKHWAEIINARNASGETITKWCKQQGINIKTYYYWQTQLRAAALEQMATTQNRSQQGLLPSKFTEVKIASDLQNVPLEETMHDEIRINTLGIQIAAGSGYPVRSLIELLKGLESSC
jgi:putative transposase